MHVVHLVHVLQCPAHLQLGWGYGSSSGQIRYLSDVVGCVGLCGAVRLIGHLFEELAAGHAGIR